MQKLSVTTGGVSLTAKLSVTSHIISGITLKSVLNKFAEVLLLTAYMPMKLLYLHLKSEIN